MKKAVLIVFLIFHIFGCHSKQSATGNDQLIGLWQSENGELIRFYPDSVGMWGDLYISWEAITSNGQNYLFVDNGTSRNSYLIKPNNEEINLTGVTFRQYNPQLTATIDGSSVSIKLNPIRSSS